jgi:hypothetical protein
MGGLFFRHFYKLPANNKFHKVISMNNRPILEAINSPKQAIDGIRNALYAMHKLALVFTKSTDDSPVYRVNTTDDTLRFPPSLASVIYAAFHRNDDPEYFDLIAEAATGDIARSYRNPNVNDIEKDAGFRYDPASRRIVPFGKKGNPEDRKKQAVSSQKLSDYNRNSIKEARKTVVGILNNPEHLKSLGAKFGVYLFDLISHIESKRLSMPLLDDFGHMMNTYRQQYVSELTASKPLSAVENDKDGNPIKRYLQPNAVGFSNNMNNQPNESDQNTISDTEIYTYIACRMSETYGSGILEHSLEDKGAAHTKNVPDTAEYVREWIEGEGLPDENEHQTGEGRSEYLALNIANPSLDLSGAPVAPQYLKPLFAKDCARFMKKRGGVRLGDINDIVRGYEKMAKLFGVSLRQQKEDEEISKYIEYMRDEINTKIDRLSRDVRAAVQVHEQGVAVLSAEAGDEVSDNILSQVFQGGKSEYSCVSGAGDEILLRKTSVERGEITSRAIRAVKRYPGKYQVLSDNKTNGELDIKMGDDVVKLKHGDVEGADNYTMPVLFPYFDSSESFTTYTIWKGIVPYTRMVDNKMEYLNDEDQELHSTRVAEGEDIASGAISSLNARNRAVDLSGRDTFEVPELSKQELAATLPPTKAGQKFSNADAVRSFDEKTLHAYSIIANIEAYDADLNQFIGNKLPNANAPVRFAFMDVYGSIPTMVSDASNEELLKMVAERAKEYAAVMSANHLDATSSAEEADNTRKLVQSYGKEFATDLFTTLNSKNIPAEIATAYDNDERDTMTAFRKLLQDLCGAANSIATGYGYHGIDVTGMYSGGKYDEGNRISVSFNSAGNAEPIGRFRDTNGVIAAQREMEQGIIKTAETILSASTMVGERGRNAAIADAAAQLLERVPVDAAAKTSLEHQVEKAIIQPNGKYVELGKIYASLYSVLVNLIVHGPVTESVKPWLMSGANTKAIDKAMAELMKKKTLPKIEHRRAILRQLTGNGALINALTDAFRGSTIGDSGEHAAYAELAAAAIGAVEGAKNLEDLKNKVVHFFHTSPRKLSDMDMNDTVSLDDTDHELEAPDENPNGVGEEVASNFKTWTPSNSGTYDGLTGKMGFDTIKVGNTSSGIGSIRPLTVGESAYSGLNKSAVQKCAEYIQSAREDLQEFADKNGTDLANVGKANVRKLWADEVIDYIATKYMDSKMRLKLRQSPNGAVVVDAASGEEWRKIVDEVVTGLKTRCSRYMPETAAMRHELKEFLTDGFEIGPDNTLVEISKVSTAFAHIILRVGDITKTEATPNPYAGQEIPVSIIPAAMRDVAKQRSSADDNVTSDAAREALNSAMNSVINDDNLSREIESIYHDFGMHSTEGYDRKLDTIRAAKHAAYNKTHRAESEINRSYAPNVEAAAAYGAILDCESEGDAEYSKLVSRFASMIQTDPKMPFGDLLETLALNDTCVNGPFAGKTYAEMAFGKSAGMLSGKRLAVMLKNKTVIESLVKAIRYQMTDRLLSNGTFGPMRRNNPEMMERISETFFNLAGNLASGHAATIFAALDPAERNAGHEAHLHNIAEDLNADATAGAQYDSDEYIKNLTGQYPDRGVKADDRLADAVTQILGFDAINAKERREMRDEGFETLGEIGGSDAVAYMQEELGKPYVQDKINGSVNEKNALKNAMIDRIVNAFGSNPRERYKSTAIVDAEEAKTYEQIANAIYNIYKYHQVEDSEERKKSAMEKEGNAYTPSPEVAALKQKAGWGVRYVESVLGAKAEQFIVNNMRLLDNTSGDPREVIDDVLDRMRTSHSAIPDAIMDYSKDHANPKKTALRGPAARRVQEMEKNLGMLKMPSVGSVNEQNRRMRLVDGAHGVSAITQANRESLDKIMGNVQKKLSTLNVEMSTEQKRIVREDLRFNTGFTGSIDKFCNEVNASTNPNAQAYLAETYAHDMNNYDMAELRKYLRSSIGAVSIDAGKTPMSGSIDDGIIRLIARSDIPGIHMVTGSDGEESDQVQFGNDKALPVDSPDAHMQMTLIINRAEKELGHSVFTSDGNLDSESKKVIAKVVRGNTAPIDPMVAAKQLVPVIIGIIQRSIQNDAGKDTGKQWAKVTDDGNFLREQTDYQGNIFVAKFGEGKIATIVHGVVGSTFSDATQNDIREEIRQYLTQTKGTVKGGLPDLEKKIKDDITKEITRRAKDMVAKGIIKTSKDNLVVIWKNPPQAVVQKNDVDV